MIWSEFKKRLEKLGVRDGDELWYLDFHGQHLTLQYGNGKDGFPLGWAVTDNSTVDKVVEKPS